MDEKIAIYHALIIKGYEKWINHFEMLYGWMKILSEVMEIILCVFDGTRMVYIHPQKCLFLLLRGLAPQSFAH